MKISPSFPFFRSKINAFIEDFFKEKRYYKAELSSEYLIRELSTPFKHEEIRLKIPMDPLKIRLGMTEHEVSGVLGKRRYSLSLPSADSQSAIRVCFYSVCIFDIYLLCQVHYLNDSAVYVGIKTPGLVSREVIKVILAFLNRKIGSPEVNTRLADEIISKGKIWFTDICNNDALISFNGRFQLNYFSRGSLHQAAGVD